MKIIKPLMLSKMPLLQTLTPTPELYLGSSIVLETACTLCLSNVNHNKLWFIYKDISRDSLIKVIL